MISEFLKLLFLKIKLPSPKPFPISGLNLKTALQTMVCKAYTTKLSLAFKTESLTNGLPSNHAGWQAVWKTGKLPVRNVGKVRIGKCIQREGGSTVLEKSKWANCFHTWLLDCRGKLVIIGLMTFEISAQQGNRSSSEPPKHGVEL